MTHPLFSFFSHTQSSPMTQTRSSHAESGFSLLELLLVMGVIGILMLGVTQITRSWVDGESSNTAGQHMARVTNIVQKYINARGLTLPESDDVLADGALAGSDWEDLYNMLDEEGLLAADGSLQSPAGSALMITYSNVGGMHRAAIFTTTNLPNLRALKIARHIGTTGGTVATTPASPSPATANSALGAFGQWQIPLADLMPSGFLFPCARTATNGCVISVVGYSTEELCGPYLFRDSALCGVAGNTMHTSLDMNGNSIQNAGDVDTENLTVTTLANLGDTNVNGTATLNGEVTASDTMSVGGAMTVNGDAFFSENVTMNGAGNTLNVTNLNSHTVTSTDISTNNLNATNMNVNGNMLVNSNMTVQGNLNVNSSSALAPSTIYANVVNAGQVNANGGGINAGTMTVKNTMTVTGGLRINSTTPGARTVIADRLITDDCTRIGTGPYDYYGPSC